jgi:acetolactate synthase-1/2/3 large subunit
MPKRRGADLLIEALRQGGVSALFTLSGNHIMAVFDAAVGGELNLYHVRHEAAAVHMADAFARLTGEVGIAMVTGGQGHANAVGALCTALAGETPLILLSGHAPLRELGRGAFQEIRQADIAAPLTKASWTAQTAAGLPDDIARAFRIARSGRPGPVHVSLPSDVLEALVDDTVAMPPPSAFLAEPLTLSDATARQILERIAAAKRPLVIAPPALCTKTGRALLADLQTACHVPVLAMESPRGINDPALGAVASVLAVADLIVLLGKPLDFTLRFGSAPAVPADCAWIVVDPDAALIERATYGLEERLVLSAIAGAKEAATALIAARPAIDEPSRAAWLNQVHSRVVLRPAGQFPTTADNGGPMHPAALCAALRPFLQSHADATFISDGGEIGQWAQAVLDAPNRVINGVAGAIGPALPFAMAACVAHPGAPVIAVLGDGTAGFHIAEFDTAVRYGLPFVAVIGNDSRWNAEYQIQLRDYGAARAQGCLLSSETRYDLVATALGGHGAFVTRYDDLPAALERAFASGKPACINVIVEGVAAPVVRGP